MVEMLDGLRDLNIASLLFRIVLALVIGGSIGLERGIKNQPAGFRTYMLVCLGATLVMLTNQYICEQFGGGDPARMGAQVISGIGFLGAGTIIVTRNNRVRGLTTAAGLWSAACMGLALGIGFYEGALITGLAIMMIMTVFQKLDLIMQEHSKFLHLYLCFDSNTGLNEFMERCRIMNIKIIDVQVSKGKKGSKSGGLCVIATLKTLQSGRHVEVLGELSDIDGIKCMEEI